VDNVYLTVSGATPATYPGSLVEPGLTRRDDLAGLNLARVPAVFIECANMRNPDDAAAVTDPDWRQSAAQGIAAGVLSYLASR
jgi:N-acetylmuramoyl-L-alanine amidase